MNTEGPPTTPQQIALPPKRLGVNDDPAPTVCYARQYSLNYSRQACCQYELARTHARTARLALALRAADRD